MFLKFKKNLKCRIKNISGDHKKLKSRYERYPGEYSIDYIKSYGHLPHYLVVTESAGDRALSNNFPDNFNNAMKIPGFDNHYQLGDTIYVDVSDNHFQQLNSAISIYWLSYLSLVCKQNKINFCGIVVCLSAQTLLEKNPAYLNQLSDQFRDCIFNVEKNIGVYLPVFMSVSKCESIYGFTDFVSEYSRINTYQISGCINKGRMIDDFITSVFNRLYQQLCIARLDIIIAELADNKKTNWIEFPEMFYALQEKLHLFSNYLFCVEENKYSHNPCESLATLHGLSFSCSIVESGKVNDNLMDVNGLVSLQDNMRERNVPPGLIAKNHYPFCSKTDRNVLRGFSLVVLFLLFIFSATMVFSFSKNQALFDQIYDYDHKMINRINIGNFPVEQLESLGKIIIPIKKAVKQNSIFSLDFSHGRKLVGELEQIFKQKCTSVTHVDNQDKGCL